MAERARRSDHGSYAMSWTAKGENVMTEIIERICLSLNVTPDEIMEILPNEPADKGEDS